MTKTEKSVTFMDVATFLRLCAVKLEYVADPCEIKRKGTLALAFAGATVKSLDEKGNFLGGQLERRCYLLEKYENCGSPDFIVFLLNHFADTFEFVGLTQYAGR